MPKFTPQVIDFIRDFVIEDIQKVLKCSAADAQDALHRIVTQPVNQSGGHQVKKQQDRPRLFHRVKSFVVETKTPEAPTNPRLKGQYSNQNAWDKYEL